MLLGDESSIDGEVEADGSPIALLEEADEEAAAGADIDHEAFWRVLESTLDEADMVHEDEAAIGFDEFAGGAFAAEPVAGRVIVGDLCLRRPGMQADQTALEAGDDAEGLLGGLKEAVGAFKEDLAIGRTAAGTEARLAIEETVVGGDGCGNGCYSDCSMSSLKVMRYFHKRA